MTVKNFIPSLQCIDKILLMPLCPVTNGRPTRMTAAGFAAACGHHRRNMVSWTHGHHRADARPNYCSVCKGKNIPAELEIVTIEQMLDSPNKGGDMAGIVKHGPCASCGKTKNTTSCSGDHICSSCAALYGAINNRPKTVLKAIKKLKPDLLASHGAADPGLKDAVDCIKQALGVEDIDRAVEAIATSANLLERYRDQAQRLAAENTALACQIRDREEANHAVSERLRQRELLCGEYHEMLCAIAEDVSEVWDREDCDVKAVPRMVRTALDQAGRPLPGDLRLEGSGLDSHLLDLALDAMRGKVTGLDPDRIALLREVA